MRIPEPWRNSQACRYGFVDPVPTAWLARWRNPDPLPVTDGGADLALVDMEAFWEILKRDGMREPIMMRVCLVTGMGRLEAGNHRCWLAERHGLPSLPCTVVLAEGPIGEPGNGLHVFDLRGELRIPLAASAPCPVMAAPSHVFRRPEASVHA